MDIMEDTSIRAAKIDHTLALYEVDSSMYVWYDIDETDGPIVLKMRKTRLEAIDDAFNAGYTLYKLL